MRRLYSYQRIPAPLHKYNPCLHLVDSELSARGLAACLQLFHLNPLTITYTGFWWLATHAGPATARLGYQHPCFSGPCGTLRHDLCSLLTLDLCRVPVVLSVALAAIAARPGRAVLDDMCVCVVFVAGSACRLCSIYHCGSFVSNT